MTRPIAHPSRAPHVIVWLAAMHAATILALVVWALT
jgi:hypothetical protein